MLATLETQETTVRAIEPYTVTVNTRRGSKTVRTSLTGDDAARILQDIVNAEPNNSFAHDLLFAPYGWTPKQRDWAIVLAQEWLDRQAKQSTGALEGEAIENFERILELLRTAQASGLKWPKIRLETSEGQKLVLSLAGPNSRHCGQIMVTDGGSYGNNVYFGRIDLTGQFVGRNAPEDILEALQQLACDPAARASLHGLQTGHCCFCGLELTDGRSVSVGYGPICADKYALPWG